MTQTAYPIETISFDYGLMPDQEDIYEQSPLEGPDYQNNIPYSDDEDEKNCPILYYNLPAKHTKPSLSKNSTATPKTSKNNKVKENQDIFADATVQMKKIYKLPEPRGEIVNIWHFPEKDLLFALLKDNRTVKVYRTSDFKMVMLKKFERPVKLMTYAQECNKLIVGGDDFYLELCNATTFETEAISKSERSVRIETIAYIKKSNVIAAGVQEGIHMLSMKLELLYINSNSTGYDLKLWNLKKRKIAVQPIYTDHVSYATVIRRGVVTCLTCEDKFRERGQIVQVIFNCKKKELETFEIGPTEIRLSQFSQLHQLQNSKYFVAMPSHKYEAPLLLKITVRNVQIVKTIIGAGCDISMLNKGIMINKSNVLVNLDKQGCVNVYRFVVKKKKPDQKNDEKR